MDTPQHPNFTGPEDNDRRDPDKQAEGKPVEAHFVEARLVEPPIQTAEQNPCGAEQNPYSVTSWGDPNAAVVTSAATSAQPRPRWWTPLLVCGVSGMLFLAASGVMTFVAIFAVHGSLSRDILTDPNAFRAVMASRTGFLMVVVVPQLALVAPAIIAAIASPVPTLQRLSLVRGSWPIWAWFAAAAATPLVGMISSLVVGLFLQESESLKEMSEIFRGHGANGFAIPLALLIGATPALCEELLFRGYIQTRLTRCFPPLLGVLVASLVFAGFHGDFVHIVAIFPLGFFLGLVTWRSGSLFPAMLGHFCNNVISVIAVLSNPAEDPESLGLPALMVALAIFGLGILGMMATAYAMFCYRPTGPSPGEPTELGQGLGLSKDG